MQPVVPGANTQRQPQENKVRKRPGQHSVVTGSIVSTHIKTWNLSGAQEEEVDGYDGKVSGGGAGSIETCRDTDMITSRKLPCYRLDAHILIDTCRGRQLLVVEQVLDVSAHTVVFMHACQDTDKACLYMYKALGRICILREIKFAWNYEKQAHPRRKQCEHP